MNKNSRAYLDYNATAPLLECARVAMLESLSLFGNASSIHFEGRGARKLIEHARTQLASLVNATPANVVFTSGATEAANHILTPIFSTGGKQLQISKLYASATEHPCILSGGRFDERDVVLLGVDANGILKLDLLEQQLATHDMEAGIPMVAVQYANNETGVIQPLADIEKLVHTYQGIFVVDAVQALGKIDFSLAEIGADFILLSSHKIGGPQGAGALVLANGALSPAPLIKGGGQENRYRSGTENVAAIAGFGAAAEWVSKNMSENINKSDMRDSIEDIICSISHENGSDQPGFFGKEVARLPNTSCFSVSGIKAETALVALDLEGVSVSTGSACSSGKVKKSHVLEAMGVNETQVSAALRISLGWNSTQEDIDRFAQAWKKINGRLAA